MSDDAPPPIAPALSVDQWEMMQEVIASHPSGKLGWFVLARREGPALELDFHGPDRRWVVDDPHALAALCLYEQPFGFTQEDVALLQREADDSAPDEAVRCLALADRIAALLPPPS